MTECMLFARLMGEEAVTDDVPPPGPAERSEMKKWLEQAHRDGYRAGEQAGAAAERARIVAMLRDHPEGCDLIATAIREAFADGVSATSEITDYVVAALADAIEKGSGYD